MLVSYSFSISWILFYSTTYFGLSYITFKFLKREDIIDLLKLPPTGEEWPYNCHLLMQNHILNHLPFSYPDIFPGPISSSQIYDYF